MPRGKRRKRGEIKRPSPFYGGKCVASSDMENKSESEESAGLKYDCERNDVYHRSTVEGEKRLWQKKISHVHGERKS